MRHFRPTAFDLSLVFLDLLNFSSISLLSVSLRFFGFSRCSLREPASRILLSKSIPISKNTHVIRKNLELVRGALGIAVPDNARDFEFSIATGPDNQAEAQNAALRTGAGYAILNPGGGWPTKT